MMTESLREAWRHFRTPKNLIVVGILIGLSFALEGMWILQYPGVLMMQAIDRQRTPIMADNVAIVKITREEYASHDLFDGSSPLKADKLMGLVDDIKTLGAKVVAVDIDTADKTFAEYSKRPEYKKKYLDGSDIWARGVELDGDNLKASTFLGPDHLEESPYAGIAGFERDPDFVVRKMQGCVPLEGRLKQTFHRAVFLAFKPDRNICVDQAIPEVRYRFPTITAGEVETAIKSHLFGDLLKNKIVVLGGTYSIQDYHPGPTGSMVPGVELVASAIEAQIHESRPGKFWETTIGILADVFFGFLILWIYATHRAPLFKLFASLALSGFVLFVPGVLLYWYGIWAVNPFLVAFGMILDQMYEAANAAEKTSSVVSVVKEKIRVEYHSSTTQD
jgi:CHASE2 domain-containing sensor protein